MTNDGNSQVSSAPPKVAASCLPRPEAWNTVPALLAGLLGWGAGGTYAAVAAMLATAFMIAVIGARRHGPLQDGRDRKDFRSDLQACLLVGFAGSAIGTLMSMSMPMDGLLSEVSFIALFVGFVLLCLWLAVLSMVLGVPILLPIVASALALITLSVVLGFAFGVQGAAPSFRWIVPEPQGALMRALWAQSYLDYRATIPGVATRIPAALLSIAAATAASMALARAYAATGDTGTAADRGLAMAVCLLAVPVVGMLAFSALEPVRPSSDALAARGRAEWGRSVVALCRAMESDQNDRIAAAKGTAEAARLAVRAERARVSAGC